MFRMFETNVENVRDSVLNSNQKLRMIEVEQLTNSLTQIGKNSAMLKGKLLNFIMQKVIEKKRLNFYFFILKL